MAHIASDLAVCNKDPCNLEMCLLQKSWLLYCAPCCSWLLRFWQMPMTQLEAPHLSSCCHIAPPSMAGRKIKLLDYVTRSSDTIRLEAFTFKSFHELKVLLLFDPPWACFHQKGCSCLHWLRIDHQYPPCWSFGSHQACQKMCWHKNQHTGIRGQVFAKLRKVNQAYQSIWPIIDKG